MLKKLTQKFNDFEKIIKNNLFEVLKKENSSFELYKKYDKNNNGYNFQREFLISKYLEKINIKIVFYNLDNNINLEEKVNIKMNIMDEEYESELMNYETFKNKLFLLNQELTNMSINFVIDIDLLKKEFLKHFDFLGQTSIQEKGNKYISEIIEITPKESLKKYISNSRMLKDMEDELNESKKQLKKELEDYKSKLYAKYDIENKERKIYEIEKNIKYELLVISPILTQYYDKMKIKFETRAKNLDDFISITLEKIKEKLNNKKEKTLNNKK